MLYRPMRNGADRGWTRSLNAMATGAASVSPAGGMALPDLSNVNLIGEFSMGKSRGAPELTANATATFFNSVPTGSTAGSLRDFRLSTQLDVPLREIGGVGQPRLS